MTDQPHIDLEPLSRGAARLALAVIEHDDPALALAVADMPPVAMAEAVKDLAAGWIAVMLIALRDQGMNTGDAPEALHNALRTHLGRDLTT